MTLPSSEGMMTTIGIAGKEFLINGEPTYAGRTFEGHKIQGLLFNVRAVQATFDDANPNTRHYWAFPDTGAWDPDRNVSELCNALPSWRDHGVLALTINFQGGGPLYVPEIYQNYDNNAFTPDGSLKPAYADRISRVLRRADELGMIVICGLFYWVQLLKMDSEKAIWRAAHEACSFLTSTGRRNVLVEIANEIEIVFKKTSLDLFTAERQADMLATLRAAHPAFAYSTSFIASRVNLANNYPPSRLVEEMDYVLLHGNGTRPPQLASALQAMHAMPALVNNPKPLLINEDSPAVANLDAAWRTYVSWGYYDQGFEGQADDPYVWYEDKPRFNDKPYKELNGFQTPPVNWTINTPFKRTFFNRVAEVTGYPGNPGQR